jgi:hypothetical protein
MGYGRTYLSGTQPAAAAVNRFVTTVDMKIATAYTVDTPAMPEANTARKVTCTRTVVGNADTPGTLRVTGTDLAGQTITETLTVGAHGVLVTGTKWFRTVTVVQGAGWVIDQAADTITVGCAADAIIAQGSGTLHGIQINTTANGTITISDAGGTIAVLPVNVAVGTFYTWDVNWSGWLRVVMAAASDITVLHSGSMPSSYSM